jgi:hypothetical protein
MHAPTEKFTSRKDEWRWVIKWLVLFNNNKILHPEAAADAQQGTV